MLGKWKRLSFISKAIIIWLSCSITIPGIIWLISGSIDTAIVFFVPIFGSGIATACRCRDNYETDRFLKELTASRN